jgi:cell division septation protein DedD
MPKPDPSIEVIEEKVESDKLTFFDALPKGEQQPLGTGINLPPEATDPVADKIAQQPVVSPPPPVKVAPASVKPVVKTVKTVVATASASYELQVSSFKSPDEAGILLRRLEKKGYRPYIQQADLGSKGIWYRVFIGPYANKEKARTAAISLKAREKLDSLVRRK